MLEYKLVVTLFYTYNKIGTSPDIKNRAITMIQEFKDRMLKNINYYETNDLIKANSRFLQTIIDRCTRSDIIKIHRKTEMFYKGCVETWL